MKRSNKLLLGGFLTVIVMVTGFHIALYAKYKNGHYTIYHPEDERGNDRMQTFPAVSFVVIRNVGNAALQFGDRAAVEKGKDELIQTVQKGDSLIITGHHFSDYPDGRRINITLPYNATLSADNSFLYLAKGKTDAATNPVIFLQKSHAIISERNVPFQLGTVKVVASDSSILAFHGNTKVNDLEVQLSNSALEYNEGEVGQISIVTDSISRLSLQSRHLLKAKIKTLITTFPTNP